MAKQIEISKLVSISTSQGQSRMFSMGPITAFCEGDTSNSMIIRSHTSTLKQSRRRFGNLPPMAFPRSRVANSQRGLLSMFNYNLPPDVRFHLQNILPLGIVGPKKPVDPDSFLWPAIQELLRLLVGVRAFDAVSSKVFCLRAFLRSSQCLEISQPSPY